MPKVLLFLPLCYFFTVQVFGQDRELEAIDVLVNEGEYQRARALLGPLRESYEENGEVLELSGDLAAYQQEWEDAIDIYAALLEKDPEGANYHFKYAASLAMKALEGARWKAVFKIPEIEGHFLKAAQLDSQHIEVRWALIELYLQLPPFLGGGEEKAVVYAAELEDISEVDGYLAKGHIAEVSGNLEAAEGHYRKAVARGQSLHCYEKLARLYLKSQQPEKAFSTKEKALQKHGKNHLRLELGEMAARNNLELEKGSGYLESFLSNYSLQDTVPREWGYYWKSRILSLKGRNAAALKAIERALQLNKDFREGKAEHRRLLKNKR